MPSIAIFVGSMVNSGSNLEISGSVYWPGSDNVAGWNTEVAFTALSASVNAAIQSAAIAAAEAAGSGTVGALDNKTIYAGAMGL